MPARPERSASGGAPVHGVRRIGAVLELLRPDFPDITISKIRFLEAEGLLDPQRTPAGYRLYGAAEIERLRYILTAQRERFWPLKVIREALEAIDRGLEPGGEVIERPHPPAPQDDPDVPPTSFFVRREDLRLTGSELAQAAQTDDALVDELVEFGLLHPDAEGYFDESAAQVARAAGLLATFGIEVRHLSAFRSAAAREVGLVEQSVRALPEPDRADRVAEVARLCLQLHAALVKGGLHRS